MAELGVLKQVALREAWDHEAHRFTPWLYKHLDLLGDAIGMRLEPVEKEAQVGRFSADILARDTDNENHRVLIENQLQGSDHDHLGKIVTYLGGRDARTAIWVAAGFEEEHLSAFQWLNEHTHEDCAFFAVRVKAVRIDDSRPAPQFEVVARPNHWERRRRHEARKGLSARGQLHKSFWEYVTASDPESWAGVPPSALRNLYWSGGEEGAWASLRLCVFCTLESVGIFLGCKPKVAVEQADSILQPLADRLSKRLDAEMGKGPFYYERRRPADIADRTQWPELARWLTEKLNLYRTTIGELAAAPPAA